MNGIFSNIIEYIGYLATSLVVVSIMMKSLVKLRIVNMIGGVLFVIYASIIGAYPVLFLNITLALINAYYLFVYPTKDKTHINLLPIQIEELEKLDFFNNHKQDITSIFGNTDLSLCNEIYLLLKNNQVAGIFAGNKTDKTFKIMLDYVSPLYRDYKIGNVLFHEHTKLLLSRGITKLFIDTDNKAHQEYVSKMGFSLQDNTKYVLELN